MLRFDDADMMDFRCRKLLVNRLCNGKSAPTAIKRSFPLVTVESQILNRNK
jgi:hypothetical protein